MRSRIVAAGVVGIAMLAGAVQAQTPAELDYCNRLAAYYDQYNRRGEGQIQAGGVDRVIGLERCRKGEVAAGTAQLRRAIQLIGFDPPK